MKESPSATCSGQSQQHSALSASTTSAGSARPATLSEYASKELLASYGIPTTRECLAGDADEAVTEATALGFPVVVKLCGPRIAHKTERDGVRLGLSAAGVVRQVAEELLALVRP